MSEEKNLYHALIEIDMPMKENETMAEAKQRMMDILRKTDIDYLVAHVLYTDVIHGEETNVYECPKCGSFLGYENECNEEHYQSLYCSDCGQKLDWSKRTDG